MTQSSLPIVIPAVTVIVMRNLADSPEALMMKRAKGAIAGNWAQIAGSIEPGERAWETAVREVYEETEIRPQSLFSCCFLEQFYVPDLDCVHMLPVFAAIAPDDCDVVINEEHSEFRWVTFSEAVAPVTNGNQRVMLRRVFSEFSEAGTELWNEIDLSAVAQ